MAALPQLSQKLGGPALRGGGGAVSVLVARSLAGRPRPLSRPALSRPRPPPPSGWQGGQGFPAGGGPSPASSVASFPLRPSLPSSLRAGLPPQAASLAPPGAPLNGQPRLREPARPRSASPPSGASFGAGPTEPANQAASDLINTDPAQNQVQTRSTPPWNQSSQFCPSWEQDPVHLGTSQTSSIPVGNKIHPSLVPDPT